jgi:hypothetical protein
MPIHGLKLERGEFIEVHVGSHAQVRLRARTQVNWAGRR